MVLVVSFINGQEATFTSEDEVNELHSWFFNLDDETLCVDEGDDTYLLKRSKICYMIMK